jgi:hypothetical protein
MRLDPRVIAIAKQFEPSLPTANFTDENRRAWMMQVIEQVVFQFPAGGWGAKRADPGRPLSKDAIALQAEGHLFAFDLVNGGTMRVNDSVEGEQIDGQVFVPVQGKDHLGLHPITPAPDPSVPPPPAADPRVFEAVQKIQNTLADLSTRLERLEQASAGTRTDVAALTAALQHVAAAVSAPRNMTIHGGVLGNVNGTLAPPQV